MNQDETVFGARNRTLDEKEVVLLINCDDGQILDGNALVAEMSGHRLALENMARIAAGPA